MGSREEDTLKGERLRDINQHVKLAKTGIITQVYEYDSKDSPWNYNVDVRITEDEHPRKVPVATPIPELTAPPRSSEHPNGPDQALVQYLDGDDNPRPIVTHILYNDVDRPAIGSQGLVRLRRGDLFVEMASEGNHIKIGHTSGSEVSMDDGQNIEINVQGNVTISSDGDVVIDEGGTAEPVAKQDHTHDYSWTDSGGSGTTSPPNESGTNTEIG